MGTLKMRRVNEEEMTGAISAMTVIDSAKKMANKKVGFFRRYLYSIGDNPYKGNKRLSIIWHNAFYDERNKKVKKL